MSELSGTPFSLTYSQSLPTSLWQAAHPARYDQAELAFWNAPLAQALGIDHRTPEQWCDIFAGRAALDGLPAIAQAYAGHQFGYFTNLGDGRAHLLGEWISPLGIRHDLQLKGSGQTAYSRRGDGKAALGPMVKELVFSEALAALDIPTTRSLAVLRTHEAVYREREEPGAVLARIAQSHIRVGTFQFARAMDYNSGAATLLPALLQYTVQRHFPELQDSTTVALDFFRAVSDRQANLIARWQAVGFIHGVMNTDNALVSGETIDFGPCAWLDIADPNSVFSSIDRNGRYAYGNQPRIAQWNLARLGEALLPLLHQDEAQGQTLIQEILQQFSTQCSDQTQQNLLNKLGITQGVPPKVKARAVSLLQEWLHFLNQSRADYVQSHRALTDQPESAAVPSPQWREAWLALAPDFASMRRCNPLVSPRNHAVQELLDLLHHDPGQGLRELPFILRCLQNPFETDQKNPWFAKLREIRPENTPPHVTFCGT